MHVEFGSDSDKSSKLGVDSGRLKLSRYHSFFLSTLTLNLKSFMQG